MKNLCRTKVFTIKPDNSTISKIVESILQWLSSSKARILREALGGDVYLSDVVLLRREIVNIWNIAEVLPVLLPRFVEMCTVVDKLKGNVDLLRENFLLEELQRLATLCHRRDYLEVMLIREEIESFRLLEHIVYAAYLKLCRKSRVSCDKAFEISSIVKESVDEFFRSNK